MAEQTLPTTARAWHLEVRPRGWPVPSGFSLRDLELPALGAGQLLNTLDAFLALMRGENVGKMIIRL